MRKEEKLLLKSKELEMKENQIEELKESYSSALKEIDKLIKTQQETAETFSNLLDELDKNEETNISFDEEFLRLYKKNSKEILNKLESISGSAISLEEKIDVNNGYLETISYTGIVSVCGFGFLAGLILMSIFSRFFRA